MTRASAIQRGTDSFILIGGWTNLGYYISDIYMFDENGLSMMEENALQVGRSYHVVMPIAADDFTCG